MKRRIEEEEEEALLQQHLYYLTSLATSLAAAMPQMEPVPTGNLPRGFDPLSCSSVFVGNINVKATKSLLAKVFESVGVLKGCKLIKNEKSSSGFVDYTDHKSAALAIILLHGWPLCSQAIKVNWAYAWHPRVDTSGHTKIFVSDLSPEITDATLFAHFRRYPSCSDARVVWDYKIARSKEFGFVFFTNHQAAEFAISHMNGTKLGNKKIKCKPARGAGFSKNKQNNYKQNTVLCTTGSSDGGPKNTNEDAPENNPACTTIHVDNLTSEVTLAELHLQFHALEAGTIEEVHIERDQGFGFIRYHTHEEAARAIQKSKGRKMICGKFMKCIWDSKQTPPETLSNPLPPPVPVPLFRILATPEMNCGDLAVEQDNRRLSDFLPMSLLDM